MFDIIRRDKDKKEESNDIPNEKFYVEIKPDTEIIRAENPEQLKLITKLENAKALPEDELPALEEDEVCGHWEREVNFLSEVDYELHKKIGTDPVVSGYCPDCGKTLGQPKSGWSPKITYKKK